ncbi:MAG: 4-hydroxy-3-methylbut-2-enyl diphosphate reductase [Oscillospiraceae bacterium]|jgi:4-hydroxy-3-methylbut-2-enyl diphosphate reductase|nr:4-hydroxy-3-methylbut-2-enyl diphosphate reductase [Oscillospiraceae bacterium]
MEKDKIVRIAQKAGFCFGVDRALKIVYNELEKNRKIATLGEIIHNSDVCMELEQKGVRVITKAAELCPDEICILPSHGATFDIRNEILLKGGKDATCPKVKHILETVSELETDMVFIMGEEEHVEIKGIVSYCTICYKVFHNSAVLEDFLVKSSQILKKYIAIISQTTYNTDDWEKSVEILKKYNLDFVQYNTICKATYLRQKETEEIAKDSDVVFVIGGYNSSNTIKLVEISRKYCKTYHIRNAGDLNREMFENARKIGITAGASTPSYVIQSVAKYIKGEQ